MSDIILFAGGETDEWGDKFTCDYCGGPAFCLDGSGNILCKECAAEQYPLEVEP